MTPVIMRRENMHVHAFILLIINILIWNKNQYKIRLRNPVLAPNKSMSLQKPLAIEAHNKNNNYNNNW
jgi:hypothetical protein